MLVLFGKKSAPSTFLKPDSTGSQGIQNDNHVKGFLYKSPRSRVNEAEGSEDHGNDAQAHADPDALPCHAHNMPTQAHRSYHTQDIFGIIAVASRIDNTGERSCRYTFSCRPDLGKIILDMLIRLPLSVSAVVTGRKTVQRRRPSL